MSYEQAEPVRDYCGLDCMDILWASFVWICFIRLAVAKTPKLKAQHASAGIDKSTDSIDISFDPVSALALALSIMVNP